MKATKTKKQKNKNKTKKQITKIENTSLFWILIIAV